MVPSENVTRNRVNESTKSDKMSLGLMGAGAVACALVWFYRRRRNLTFKIKDLVNMLELGGSYGLVCLVDRAFTTEMDKIIQTFVDTTDQMTCVLHIHPPEHAKSEHVKLRHLHLTTDASVAYGLLIDGSPKHCDEVMLKLFEKMNSRKYIIIDGDKPRMASEKCEHTMTISELNRLLGGSVDSP